jgi:hypothetical protein
VKRLPDVASRYPIASRVLSLALAAAGQVPAGAAELAADSAAGASNPRAQASAVAAPASASARFSMPKHVFVLDPPRSGGERFALSATLSAKSVPQDVSWDARFEMRASVSPKSLASISCGSDIFSDSYEN